MYKGGWVSLGRVVVISNIKCLNHDDNSESWPFKNLNKSPLSWPHTSHMRFPLFIHYLGLFQSFSNMYSFKRNDSRTEKTDLGPCFFFFFNFTILYWFCHISTWIHHRHTRVPHPEPSSLLSPRIIPLGHPSGTLF